MPWTRRHSQRAMIAIGGGVGLSMAVAPGHTQRLFGIDPADVTGANRLGWRLFATRNLYLAALALRGDATAVDAFGRLQALDQVVFWQAFATRSVPQRTTLLAAGTSAAIVALDLHRRGVGGERGPAR